MTPYILLWSVICVGLGVLIEIFIRKTAWRFHKEDHNRYKMISVKDTGRIVYIWHGNEGWKGFVRSKYITIPLFDITHIHGIPEPTSEFRLRFCASKDGKALGFYAVSEEGKEPVVVD